ncbi:retrovirus-related pol polyprotein from transposon tnt 1-94 [Gossypium australe]|uniref:Retrovirus-related pol polyprotein from transposon tnt 1-94 n=1 Tax=Gossypium australe TaxID=47621 RepID=A0A5B6WNT8_9ROSI|nr:retrovirus-related pol polyprotein from transposon tnt 1-94 [Gossypium australe]
MDAEMDYVKSNTMWELVNLPVEIKPIGCKWIYKKKRNEEEKWKHINLDFYDKTFSMIAILKFIPILLSIAATLDYEIWQMDVKTVFLNGYLDKTIYLTQPTSYVVKGKKQKV